jgi:hypothetical protein
MSLLRVSDHVRAPGFRSIADGPYSGQWFREQYLVPQLRAAIESGEQLTVRLDGVAGYGSSFLEEAFAGLIRNKEATPDEVHRYLVVEAGAPLFQTYRDLAYRFIRSAEAEVA